MFGLRRRAAGEGGFLAEIGERPLESGREVGLRMPSQQVLRFPDIRAAPGWIVDWQGSPLDPARASHQRRDCLCDLENGALFGATEIDDFAVNARRLHQCHQSTYGVAHIAER